MSKWEGAALGSLLALLVGAGVFFSRTLMSDEEDSRVYSTRSAPRDAELHADPGARRRHPEHGASKDEPIPGQRKQRIQVVDIAGHPVAGARVQACRSESPDLPGFMGGAPDGRVLIDWDPHAKEHRSDRLGYVEVDSSSEGRKFAAEFAGRYGTQWVRVSASTARIELLPCRRFVIEVRDEAGLPVRDAIVVIDDPDCIDSGGFEIEEWEGAVLHASLTGSNGFAEFLVTRTHLHDLYAARKLRVFVLRFGGRHVQRVFDLEEKASRLRLRIPETVAVTFRARDAEGQSLGEHCEFFWAEHPVKPLNIESAAFGRRPPRAEVIGSYLETWKLDLSAGPRRIRAFAPNAELQTMLRAPVIQERRRKMTLSAMREQAFVLEGGDRKAKIAIRVVDEFGRPRTTDDLAFVFVGVNGKKRPLSFGTSGKRGSREAQVWAVEHAVLHVLKNDHGPRKISDSALEKALTTIPMKGLRPGATHHLGKIALERPALLVNGRIVDANDRPVAGVLLRVKTSGANLLNLTQCRAMQRMFATSDRKGRFEFRSDLLMTGRYVVVSDSNFLARSEEFDAGTEDLQVQVARAARISGLVDLGESTSPGKRRKKTPRVTLMNLDTGKNHGSAYVSASGRFNFYSLPAGSYLVEGKIGDQLAYLSRDVEVKAGGLVQVNLTPR